MLVRDDAFQVLFGTRADQEDLLQVGADVELGLGDFADAQFAGPGFGFLFPGIQFAAGVQIGLIAFEVAFQIADTLADDEIRMIGEDLRNPGFSVTAPAGYIEPAGGRFAHGGKHPDAQVAVLVFFNLESGPAGKPFEEIGIAEETAVQVGAHDFAGVIVGNEDYVAPGDGGSQAGQGRVFQNGRGVVNMADR